MHSHTPIQPVLLIHGGAGNLTRGSIDEAAARQALTAALEAGWRVLENGGAALDGVQAAVLCLEDSGCFSAGKGATQDSEGTVSLDAALMDGATRKAGAIAAVPWLKNPIQAARLVYEHTHHVLLVAQGAEAFLRHHNATFAAPGYFVPAHAAAAPKHGTVGAVAVDAHGQTAAATSTGGTAGKMPGRVGDSPILGAGTYADAYGAVSATGQGEFFMRTVFGHRVGAALALGQTVTQALDAALAEVTSLGGRGGGIAVSATGSWDMRLTTAGMFRGVRTVSGPPRVAIFRDETPT